MAVNRLTGLTSGMDTDKLVKDLMKVERMRYDQLEIKRTYAEWEQQAYRTTIGTINDFQSKYFDVLSTDSYLMSSSSFAAFSSTTTVAGESKNYVSVEGTAEANDMTHTIQSVDKLATQDKWHSAVFGTAAVNSSAIAASTLTDIKNEGFKMNVTIDGHTEEIEFTGAEFDEINGTPGDALTVDDLAAVMNAKIEDAFGSGYTDVVSKITDGADESIRFDKAGATVAISSVTGDTSLAKLGITSGASNESYQTKTLEELFSFTDDDLDDFKINGIAVNDLSKDDTIDEFVDKVNAANTGAKLSFNSLENRFELLSDKTGTVNGVDFEDPSDASTVFTAIGFQDAAGDGSGGVAYREKAENAIVVIDNQTIVKSENNFTIEGVKYTLNETYNGADGDIDITLKNNVDDIAKKITDFVEDYNTMIAGLYTIIQEPRNLGYDPLTTEQKESLSEDQIEKWETQAKKGILKGEDTVQLMLDKMRSAFYEPVENAGVSLADIGITTSNNYKDKGKLVIDQEDLKEALENDFDNVVTLFTKESDKAYLEKGTAGERYSENGLMNRLDDILSDVIRTSRDTDGNKGTLVEKAGVVDDASVADNALSKVLGEYDDRMDVMLDILAAKENRYYLEFSRMETALAQLQSQSASLVSSFGG